MKSPLRVGVARAPKKLLPPSSKQSGIRRKAGLALAVVSVLAAGTLSALFVDYLADRAVLRNAASQRLAAAETVETAGISTAALSDPGGLAPAAVPSAPAAPGPATASDTPPASGPAPADEATASVEPIEPANAGASSTETAAAPLEDQFAESDDLAAGQDTAMAEPETDIVDEAGVEPDALDMPAAQAESDAEDSTFTAAIPTERPESAPAPKPARKQVVDTPKPAKPKEADAALPGVEVAALPGVESAAQPSGQTGGGFGRVGRVSKDVNLRSRPENGAQVIVVVPAKASVNVLSCDKWCEVSFNGKRGWVYKSFVTASHAAPAAPAPVSKPKTRSEPVQSVR